ncbi:MAG TPA: EamA family transporter [Bauldia sp.]|nr:EamA family transporter [Bauldia sp.]
MPASPNHTMTTAEWGLLLFLSVIWGGSFFFNAVALTSIDAYTLVAARVLLGAIFLYAVLRASDGRLPTSREAWTAFAVMGTLNNVLPFTLIAWAQGTGVPSGLASILNAATPIFTVVVAHYWTDDERMTPLRIGGVIVGFAGVVVMIGGDALSHAGEHLVPELAIIAACVCYAFSAIYARRFSRMGLAPLATAAGQITASAIIMTVLVVLFDAPWRMPPPSLASIGAILGIAALSTCLAYVVYYRILATAGSVNLMLVTLLIPVTAVLLGAILLGERLAPNHFAGMAAIAAGLAAIDGRVFRRLARG